MKLYGSAWLSFLFSFFFIISNAIETLSFIAGFFILSKVSFEIKFFCSIFLEKSDQYCLVSPNLGAFRKSIKEKFTVAK